jgi:hypothetical protein
MQKFRLCLVFLALLLVAAPFQIGVSLAAELVLGNYAIQSLTASTGTNSIRFLQLLGGWNVRDFQGTGTISVGFDNVNIQGLYNLSAGVGSFKNLASVSLVNIQPQFKIPPALVIGDMWLEGNDVTVRNSSYAVHLNFNGFRCSGIIIINVMAGSFSNQLTTVTYTMGRNVIPPPSHPIFQVVPLNAKVLPAEGNQPVFGTEVSLSDAQMEATTTSFNNDIDIEGTRAVVTREGTPQVNGICAITASAGIGNQINHAVRVNLNTAP